MGTVPPQLLHQGSHGDHAPGVQREHGEDLIRLGGFRCDRPTVAELDRQLEKGSQ